MKKILALFIFPFLAYGQSSNKEGFRFGATYADFELKNFSTDTTADAVVIKEFATTHINNNQNLVYDYHSKIKILKREAIDRLANYTIPLRKGKSDQETIQEIQASTFNIDPSIKEFKVDPKNIFSENTNEYWDQKKFGFTNVKVGSILEIHYVLSSPFRFNWRSWEFQSDIPKLESEYYCHIPGNWIYNISLRGYLQLSINDTQIEKECFDLGGGQKSDCAVLHYGMKNIPAFKEEKFMTAKSNFLSSLNFELAEVRHFDGSNKKYTEEWKDVNERLKEDDQFGKQIKAARKIWGDRVQILTASTSNSEEKARLIFTEIKKYYLWNDFFGAFTKLGTRKAYQEKKGNIADINLSLIGALQSAGLDAEPTLVSTRENGLPVMIHPVMSDFNYVIARVTIGQGQFWLDASHALYAFGFVPERCLNGKVRVVGKQGDWVDLKPKDKEKKVIQVMIALKENGSLAGTMKETHYGYDAFDQRKKYFSFSSKEDYVKKETSGWRAFEAVNYSNLGADSLEKPFVELYDLNFTEPVNQNLLYISPFLIESWQKNPFVSNERTYPVDFGAPLEQTTLFIFTYPPNYSIEELPKTIGLSLPQGGGKYVFNASILNNKIQVTSTLSLNKSVYSPVEYFNIRELFSRVIQTQQSQIVLRRK